MKNWTKNFWLRLAAAGLIAGGFLFACGKLTTITFLTNDDNAIAFALAGYQTGSPYPFALFTNCLLGYFVSGLYGAFPGVPWWGVLQLAFLFLSFTVFGETLLRVCLRKGKSPAWGLCIYSVTLLCLMIQPVAQLTYTVTGAIVGGAGAVCIAGAAWEDKKGKRLSGILGGILVVLAFLYREETGYPVLCFFAAAVLFRLIKGGRGAVKGLLPLMAVVPVLCLGAFLFNTAMHDQVNGQVYTEFFTWRERFTDYPRDAYEENPSLYESAGWTQPVYNMADHWCFLDQRIDASSLKTIVTESNVNQESASLTNALHKLWTFFQEEESTWFTLLFLCALGFYLAFHGPWHKENRAGTVAGFVSVFGGLCLCVYLCLSGRFMMRSYQVVCIPLVLLLGVWAAGAEAPCSGRSLWSGRLIFIFIACVGLFGGYRSLKELRANSPKEMLADCRTVSAYALANPEKTYLRDPYTAPDIDPFTVYPVEKPVNLVSWGGCGMRSDAYHKQLAFGGLAGEDEALLLEENVYLLTRGDLGLEQILADGVKDAYGSCTCEKVDSFFSGDREFAVYQFSVQTP